MKTDKEENIYKKATYIILKNFTILSFAAVIILSIIFSIAVFGKGFTSLALFIFVIAQPIIFPETLIRDNSINKDSNDIKPLLKKLFILFYIFIGIISFLLFELGFSPFTTVETGLWEKTPIFDNMFQRILYPLFLYSNLSLCLLPLTMFPNHMPIIRISILIALAINIINMLSNFYFYVYPHGYNTHPIESYIYSYKYYIFIGIIFFFISCNYFAIKLIIQKYKQFDKN